MKYKDKNTVRLTHNWQNKPNIENVYRDYTLGKQLKSLIIPFGKMINDSFWWNSLEKWQKFRVYVEYCEFELFIDNDIWVSDSITLPLYIPIFPDLSTDEHNNRIEALKSKYFNASKRRGLVINDILK